MFANPQWFNGESTKRLPGPRSIRGWIFYTVCLNGIIGPGVLLALRGQIFPEATIWVAVASLAFWLEIRGLRKELNEREAVRNMHVIDENCTAMAETQQYELELKQPAKA